MIFTRALVAIAVAFSVNAPLVHAQAVAVPFGTHDPSDRQYESTTVIVLKDCSGSYGELPPDTSQAFVTQLIRLADLSSQPVKLGVIFFGGQGVTVLGDESGQPTAAYESLLHSLVKAWPKPEGGTPLEEAMERAVAIVNESQSDSNVLVILFSDGRPASGDLKPERYPIVRDEMDRRLKRLQTRYQGNAPAFLQNVLSRAEIEMQTPGTDTWKELLAIQHETEFEKTVKHAAALKQAGVRFLSVDYTTGIPELKRIHNAAGGTSDDYVHATPPSVIIPKLHALGLTALPRVVVEAPKQYPAELTKFDATWTAELNEIGDAALVTALFDPPIQQFDVNATLEIVLDGKRMTLSAENRDDRRLLSFDSAGNVVSATVSLDTLPKDNRLILNYSSPSATLHPPACTLYTHLRMAKDLRLDFRPTHVPSGAGTTFRVSPNQAVSFAAHLHSDAHPQPYAVAGIEPVLSDRFTGKTVRIAMQEDPQRTNVFVSEKRRLPRGSYDLDLNVVLPSGSRIVLREARVLECQTRDEFIAVEILLLADSDKMGASFSRAHLDFGEVGDAVTKHQVAFMIRAMNVDYPIAVFPSIVGLVDDQGTSPNGQWITFDRSEIQLEPGKAHRLVATLRIPEQVGESIRDGRFQGRLLFERLDLRQPIPLRRYNKVAGVPDDEPVEPVAFTLNRPTIQVKAPRGPHNAIDQRQGEAQLPIPVSVWQPFARHVVLTVHHTSVLPREITALPQATFIDRQARTIPSVRLVPGEACEVTQEVPSGGSAHWDFVFEVDADDDLSSAFGSVVLSGPGLVPLHIPVEVRVRDPLLGRTIKIACLSLAATLVVLAATAGLKYLRVQRRKTGRVFECSAGQTLPELLEFSSSRGEPRIKLEKHAVVTFPPDKTRVKLRPNHALPREALAAVSREEPCTIKADGREVHLTHVYRSGAEYVVCGTYADGGRFDGLSRGFFRKAAGRLFFAAVLAVLCIVLFHPSVLAASQWVLDVLSLS